MRLWFVDEDKALTRIEAVKRLLETPDDTEDLARRGYRRTQESNGSHRYLPRYVRLFGKATKERSA